MLAESVHSVADPGHQGLLLLGRTRVDCRPSADHPFGYGRDRYLYAFIVQYGMDQQLTGHRRRASIASHQRNRRGEAGAGAVTHRGQALRVGLEIGGSLGEPDQRGVTVLDRSGMRCSGASR